MQRVHPNSSTMVVGLCGGGGGGGRGGGWLPGKLTGHAARFGVLVAAVAAALVVAEEPLRHAARPVDLHRLHGIAERTWERLNKKPLHSYRLSYLVLVRNT